MAKERPLRLKRLIPYLLLVFLVFYISGTVWFMSEFQEGKYAKFIEPRGLLRLENVVPKSWTTEDVGLWLMVIGFPQYRKSFATHFVDGVRLLGVDKKALEDDLGVKSFLAAHKIKKMIDKLAVEERFSAAGLGIHEVSLYLTGDDLAAPTHKVMSHRTADLMELIKLASELFEMRIVRLVNELGSELKHADEVPDKLVALAEGQFFVFPLRPIGHIQDLTLTSENRTLKIETLSNSPRVLQIENFLSEAECDALISWASDKMKPSTVAIMGKEKTINDVDEVARTSETTWVEDASVLTDAIAKRAEELARIPIDFAENMQIIRYGFKKHYWAHHDYFDPKLYPDPVYQKENRFVTILFYLSDDFQGGETIFPFSKGYEPNLNFNSCEVGLKVKPKKGMAVLFYSLTAQGHQNAEVDPMSLHGSCDVQSESGTKWAANYWIRNRRQR